MPIDASIYNNIKQFEAPDLMQSQNRAMSLKQMGMQNQAMQSKLANDEIAAKEAARSRMTMNAIPEFLQLENMSSDMVPVEYNKKMKKLVAEGMPDQNLIKDQEGNYVYDPKLFQLQVRGIKSTPEWMEFEKSQLANEKTREEINKLKYREDNSLENAYKRSQIAKNYADIGKNKYENLLPPENKEQINKIAGSNATKVSIATQIDSVINSLENEKISPDQKLMQARQMIKVLNSTQGQDAVGAEEAKRLAGLLEFKLGNFTEPGPVFGRADISEFAQQAKLTSRGLKDSINENQKIIARLKTGNPLSVDVPSIDSIVPKNKGGGDPLLQNANAGSGKQGGGVGAIVLVNGKHYRVGADGDTLEPVKGKK